METQKIINFLMDSGNEESKFATKKWYIIDSETAKDKYNPNNSSKFETEAIKSSLFDYSDAFILVTGDITVAADNGTHVLFKNCAPFSTCKTKINYVFTDEANHSYIAVPMYNLIEYTSRSLWQFEPPANNADFAVNSNGAFNSQSFKYKTALVEKQKMLLIIPITL